MQVDRGLYDGRDKACLLTTYVYVSKQLESEPTISSRYDCKGSRCEDTVPPNQTLSARIGKHSSNSTTLVRRETRDTDVGLDMVQGRVSQMQQSSAYHLVS